MLFLYMLARDQPIPWSERQLGRLARLHRWLGALVASWDLAIVEYRASMRVKPSPLESSRERESQVLREKAEQDYQSACEETGLIKGTDLWPNR